MTQPEKLGEPSRRYDRVKGDLGENAWQRTSYLGPETACWTEGTACVSPSGNPRGKKKKKFEKKGMAVMPQANRTDGSGRREAKNQKEKKRRNPRQRESHCTTFFKKRARQAAQCREKGKKTKTRREPPSRRMKKKKKKKKARKFRRRITQEAPRGVFASNISTQGYGGYGHKGTSRKPPVDHVHRLLGARKKRGVGWGERKGKKET